MQVLTTLGQIGIIPVLVIEDLDTVLPLGQALLAAGLPCAEITFRTPAAAAAIAKMSTAYPDILVGAGTVLTVEQAAQARDAGAQFIVSPGFDPAVVDWCQAHHLPLTPGVMTPTDINQALARGLRILKFFPAEAVGGVKTLKAIGGPYVGIKFVPTGGINAANLADYLRLPMVHACGGSFMASKKLIAARQFDEIARLAESAVALVKSIRSP